MALIANRTLRTMAALLCNCATAPAFAQNQFEDLKRQTEDMTNLIDAENSKSDVCKRYEGNVVTPTSFKALALSLPKATEKGEFETTEQYQARIASTATRAPSGLAIITLPTDREYVRYNADTGAMFVAAGTFKAGSYSDQTSAEASALLAVGKLDGKGTPVQVSESERVVRTYSAQNLMGATFRISEIDRVTNALLLTTRSLFPFAKRDSSPVMGFDVKLADAPRVKQSFKVALVLKPQAPYLLSYSFDGVAPTASEPRHYTEHSSVIVAETVCALALDSNSRVLATADTGKLK